MTLYPIGYGSRLVTMAELRATHEPKMHPEDARRVFPYLESKRGLLGIGGGWRSQPAPGGAPLGKSFHMDQRFASGFVGYCAQDLVAVNTASLVRRIFSLNGSPANPDATTLSRALTVQAVHRAPTWAETADAPEWGLHTFIMNPPEPWHLQPIEIRGWQTWVNLGRKDPVAGIPLPNDPPPPDDEENDVLDRILRPAFPNAQWWFPYLGAFDSGAIRQMVSLDMVPREKASPEVWPFPVSDEGQYRRLCAQFNIQLEQPMAP